MTLPCHLAAQQTASPGAGEPLRQPDKYLLKRAALWLVIEA